MKLIDQLEQALIKADITHERDGWEETVGYKKPTKEGWIDITIPCSKNKSLSIHLFFKNNEKDLSDIEVFENKLETVIKSTTKISLCQI
jgi:hypothetical protein